MADKRAVPIPNRSRQSARQLVALPEPLLDQSAVDQNRKHYREDAASLAATTGEADGGDLSATALELLPDLISSHELGRAGVEPRGVRPG
jgi:hypothetical protein